MVRLYKVRQMCEQLTNGFLYVPSKQSRLYCFRKKFAPKLQCPNKTKRHIIISVILVILNGILIHETPHKFFRLVLNGKMVH